MSASTVLSHFRTLLHRIEELGPKICKLYPSGEQWCELSELSGQLVQIAKKIEVTVATQKEHQSDRAWADSKEFRDKIALSQAELSAGERLKRSVVFRRNIVTIYTGPKSSRFDSDELKSRKETTRKRCEKIKCLDPDAVILWALSFAPTLWAGGSMASDVFDCIVESITTEEIHEWPSAIREILQILRDDEGSLAASREYDQFLQGKCAAQSNLSWLIMEAVLEKESRRQPQSRKRHRVEESDIAVPVANEYHGYGEQNQRESILSDAHCL